MLLDLIVAALEHLQLVGERGLSCLRLSEEVHDFTVGEGLLDVLIVEVDDCVAIGERLALDSVVEDDFFLAVLVDALDLTVVAHVLLYDLLVRVSLAVILLRELEAEVLLLIFNGRPSRRLLQASLPLIIILLSLSVLHNSLVHHIVATCTTQTSGRIAALSSTEIIIHLVSLFLMQVIFVFVVINGSRILVAMVAVHVIIVLILVLFLEQHLVFEVILQTAYCISVVIGAFAVLLAPWSLTVVTLLVVEGVTTALGGAAS